MFEFLVATLWTQSHGRDVFYLAMSQLSSSLICLFGYFLY